LILVRAILCALLLAGALGASAFASPDLQLAMLVQNGRADEALKALTATTEKSPTDAEAHNLLCRVEFELEKWDEAIHECEKAVALVPDSSPYHQWLGRAYGEKAEASGPIGAFGLVRKVKGEFERAAALDPEGKNLSAHSDLAEFYIEAPSIMGGDKTKARQLADFIGRFDPALAHYLYGRLEEKHKSKEHAEQEYKAAINASGDSAHYWVDLASFYRREGRLDDMEAAINQSLRAKRQEAVALFDAASLLSTARRNETQAIQLLRRYISLNQFSEDAPAFQAHYLLGKLLEKQGNRTGAASEYRAALALASLYRPAQDALARASS
jgi:tetratricopeptide (TPR) repeat protein